MSSCGKPSAVEAYFTPHEADTLLVNLMTYMYVPEGVDPALRFDPRFRNTYYQSKEKFSLVRLLRVSDGYFYYLILRREGEDKRRALGGRFKANGTRVTNLEEIFVGLESERQTALGRGEYLFREMIKARGLPSGAVGLNDYVEWPNAHHHYDTLTHSWSVVDSLMRQ